MNGPFQLPFHFMGLRAPRRGRSTSLQLNLSGIEVHFHSATCVPKPKAGDTVFPRGV